MFALNKLSTFRLAIGLSVLAVWGFGASATALAADASKSPEPSAAKSAQRGPMRAMFGMNPGVAFSGRDSQNNQSRPDVAPQAFARLRDGKQGLSQNSQQKSQPNLLVVDTSSVSRQENVPDAQEPESAEELSIELPVDEGAPESPNEEPQVPTDAPQTDEAPLSADEITQAATEAQGPEIPAEVKARALSSDDEDAPDARVRLTDLDVTEDAVAEQVNETESADVPNPTIEQPVVDSSCQKIEIGYPGADRAVRDMSSDLQEQLKAHGGAELYARWRAYNASIRSRTNSLQTGNELNNRCRLNWYEKLYQDPLNSVNEAESASRVWAESFMGCGLQVLDGYRFARVRMDVPMRHEAVARQAANSPIDAIEQLKSALVEAASFHAKAVAPMSKNDLAAVMNEAYPIFCGQVQSGHTINSRGRGQYLIDAMSKMNKSALYDAGEAVLSLLNERTLAELSKIDFDSLEKTRIEGDQIVGIISTEAGDILIGDSNRTVWDLDKYSKVCCVIDLGGDDVYREGSCVLNRPLLVVLDFGKGNDEYTGKNYAIQAGAVLGVTMWYDDGGNDKYLAKDICQGSAIGGFAALVNDGGNDKYLGFRRAQGASLCGFGLLLDRDGDDDYRAALIAQGFGAPGGFGALVDKSGRDHYYVGGYFFDSYPEHPGYDGWGQGVGAGIRRVACGGIGLLLDGGGDDAYEYDYFGHGGGYWMGVGIARDFAGDDIRYAATSTMYDGSKRREQRWQRFGAGFGCHYAVGYLFDDFGDDVYGGTIMGVGMGWDLGAGFLVDFEGDDVFEATGGLTQGCGGEGSIGAILNFRGNDTYRGNYQGYANGQLSYHAPSNCGANFSFVVDHGGKDSYGGTDNSRRPIANNAITVRGYSTGLVIDRPSPTEERAGNAQETTPRTIESKVAQGYPTSVSNIKTMVAPPPLVDTTPHVTSSGTNAFNPQSDSGPGGGWFGGGGGGLFGRGGLF
ncbi:MAG: hypothetical protein IJM54_01155 [Thermoguttaceae bacterium]|nr:hypothetical protein [Thermoguttaceae bacterium]